MKVIVVRYDEAVVNPPFKFIELGSFEFDDETLERHPRPESRVVELVYPEVVKQFNETPKFWSLGREKGSIKVVIHPSEEWLTTEHQRGRYR